MSLLGGKLTAREKRKIARHYSRLKLKPTRFGRVHCKSWRRYRQCKGDIVSGGWDDPADFSWWKDAFKVLKPPRDDDNGD